MKKKDLPCIIVMAVIALGMIVESVGAVMSRTTAIGFNFSLPAVLYVGIAMIAAGFIAHFPLKAMSKRLGISSIALDAEAILMIIAMFFAVILLVCSITFPVLFPANG